MSNTITFRPDAEVRAALEELIGDPAPSRGEQSNAIRQAILDAAERLRAERIREAALSLAADPIDRDEAQKVLRDMDDLRAW